MSFAAIPPNKEKKKKEMEQTQDKETPHTTQQKLSPKSIYLSLSDSFHMHLHPPPPMPPHSSSLYTFRWFSLLIMVYSHDQLE